MKILRVALVIVLLVLAGRAFDAGAQTVTILYSFVGSPNDGANPFVGLIQGSDGNFYGTTIEGGANGNVGTVFRISASGSYTNLCSFSYSDGAYPRAVLVQGSDGNFYGTTDGGGANGGGTVFRVSPSGNYTNLYSFGSHPNDGIYPDAGLAQGSDGNFYGTTAVGGTYDSGTVFRVSPSGTYSNLHSFAGYPTDGWLPQAALVQSSDSNLYGTTDFGGADNDGTVFRISPSGTYSNLYSFSYSNGGDPEAKLVEGSDGNFYGTTYGGGTNGCNCGTVFRISPSGTYTTLYSFAGSPNDGSEPQDGLVQGSDGNFYGTTYGGGTNSCNCGTVFRISPSGTYTTLYSFAGSPNDGSEPLAGLMQGSDGNFYGTTYGGGTNGEGTVFKLTVPFSPPPNQISGIQFFSVFDSIDVAVLIPSVAGEMYQLQYSDSMSPTNWFNTGDTIPSIGGPLILTDFAESLPSQRFYRAVITP